MDRADLLARIRKCMKLAASANEHEAAAALAKARELMDQYGVDESDVVLLDVGEAVAAASLAARRPPMWALILIRSVTRAIPSHALLGSTGVTFIGLSPAPEVASYAFVVLHRQLRRARAEYIRTQLKRCSLQRKRARADVFCEGWASAIFQAVVRLHPKTPLDPLVRRYLDERHAGLASVSGRAAGVSGQVAANDRARGREQGGSVNIHQGVGHAAPTLRLGARK